MSGEEFRHGVMLMPGIYDWNGELHVDIDEFVLAAGGNPASEVDRDTAARVIARVSTAQGIPIVEVD
jgi:hypothetical protein